MVLHHRMIISIIPLTAGYQDGVSAIEVVY